MSFLETITEFFGWTTKESSIAVSPNGKSLVVEEKCNTGKPKKRRRKLPEAAVSVAKETVTKSEEDGNHPASHYLVVEDPEHPSTWHLRVRDVNGKLDHRLMGAAHAALTVGYRGNKYEGTHKREAMSKLRRLYEEEGIPFPGNKEAMSIRVFKDAKGDYRWVTVSSNAFRDLDNEIVSEASLNADVAMSEESGEYGTLRWWHLPGADIGDCDFRMVRGKMLIESGTFRSAKLAERIAPVAENLQVSIGFFHPPSEPDAEGVYHHIRTFERSLLPKGRAANPFTSLSVKGVDLMASQKEKEDELRKLVGDEIATTVLTQAERVEKEAMETGVAFKEGEEDAREPAPPSVEKKASDAEQLDEDEEEWLEDEEDMSGEDEDEDEEKEKEADMVSMPYSKLTDVLAEAVTIAIQPYSTEIESLKKALKALQDASETGKQTAEKEVSERVALKEKVEQQEKVILTLQRKVKQLMGETPKAAKGYVASEADGNIITQEEAKERAPAVDPLVLDAFKNITRTPGNAPESFQEFFNFVIPQPK